MYSVDDLLISHGYKRPKHNPSGPPARPAPSASPPSYSRHQQLLERPRTVNGFCSYTLNHSHTRDRTRERSRDRSQSRQEGRLNDAGFCDANRSLQLQPKDVSYWRRKGQDFAVLLDYTDYKEAAASRQGTYVRPERAEERGPAPLEECPRSQRPSSRDSQLLLPWRTAEKKCKSLGAEEWHPAGEQRLLTRTPEGMVLPRTKVRTQSLPRMQTNCRQYVPTFHQNTYRAPRWPDNGRPASATPLSITPKPRFTRPPRPPSYEMHQQIRGSCEVLSGRDLTRERTPLPRLRTAESQLDYFAQDCGPPGYNPPPSYKRAPIMEGVCRDYGEVTYRYRGDMYQQLHRAPDGSHWGPPHVGGCSTTAHSRQLYPVYMTQDRPGGRIQYLPFDHSSSLGGNSLTDSDKIRHIRKELPSLTVSEPASGNSAFLPPPLGPTSLVLNDSAYGEFDSDNTRWHRHLHKETVDNIPATDQNYNNRYHKIQHGRPTSPFSAFHAPVSSSGLRCKSEQGFLETITQVKQIRPDIGTKNNRNPKRRFSETIFCLVSVPVHTPTNLNKNASADQNNNDPTTNHTIPNTFAVGLKESRPVRSRSVNQVPIWSQCPQPDTSGTSSLRNYKRAPLRKEIIDAWALQANDSREVYSRSWPGNQYRNQETQTGSPLVKSPEPEDKPTQAVPGTSTDSTSANGYCLKDQKNLQLSSNSAFSLISPTQAPYKGPFAPELLPPLSDSNKERQPVTCATQSTPEPSADSAEYVSFGQFLLKPVDRRPSDYIGELESINKEMEDTISKKANLTATRKGRKKHNVHQSGAQSMEEMHLVKPAYINVRSKSFTSAADVDTETSCSVYRPQNENVLPSQEHTGFTLDSEITPQDIPVPQESMLRDVGLKVYTEIGPMEPAPRSSSVPPYQHLDELSWENITATVNMCKDSHEHKVNKESKARTSHKHHTSGVSLRICRSRSESSRSSHKRECSPHVNKLNRVKSCPGGDQPTLADEHLENLLIKEKSNSLPAEDLSHLYEVKCAEGIPENESIEQRAARILGIAVPVGALGVDKGAKQDIVESNTEKEEGNIEKEEGNIEKEEGNIEKEEGNIEKEEGNIEKEEGNIEKEEENIEKEEGNIEKEEGNIEKEEGNIEKKEGNIEKEEGNIEKEEENIEKEEGNIEKEEGNIEKEEGNIEKEEENIEKEEENIEKEEENIEKEEGNIEKEEENIEKEEENIEKEEENIEKEEGNIEKEEENIEKEEENIEKEEGNIEKEEGNIEKEEENIEKEEENIEKEEENIEKEEENIEKEEGNIEKEEENIEKEEENIEKEEGNIEKEEGNIEKEEGNIEKEEENIEKEEGNIEKEEENIEKEEGNIEKEEGNIEKEEGNIEKEEENIEKEEGNIEKEEENIEKEEGNIEKEEGNIEKKEENIEKKEENIEKEEENIEKEEGNIEKEEENMEKEEGNIENDSAKCPPSIPLIRNIELTPDVLESPPEEQSLLVKEETKQLEECAMLSEDVRSVSCEEINEKVAIDELQDNSEDHLDFEQIQGMESKEEEVIALVNNEGIKDVAELTTEDPGRAELRDEGGTGEAGPEVSKATERGDRRVAPPKPPKPKQRSRLQKPALLPKPRCVPKREISLPRHSTSSMEAPDRSTVPDSYDPSRVERV